MCRADRLRRSPHLAVLAAAIALSAGGAVRCLAASATTATESGRPARRPAGTARSPDLRHGYFRSDDGVRLHYLTGGRGPSLVFVPGWLMPAWIWGDQMRRFSPSWRVVAPDLRSQGRSQRTARKHDLPRLARDLRNLHGALGLRPSVLVGWSLGALAVVEYVHLYGTASVRAVVLVDQTIPEPLRSPPGGSPFLSRYREHPRSVVEDFVRGLFWRPRPEAWLESLVGDAQSVPVDSGVRLLSDLHDPGLWDAMHDLNRPLLYVVTADRAGEAARVRDEVPGARIEVFPDAGHALFIDEPERFAGLLSGFLKPLTAVKPKRAAGPKPAAPRHTGTGSGEAR